jgi:hypothetical protein
MPPLPKADGMTGRCQLRYQDPRTLAWRECSLKTGISLQVGGTWRSVCAEHHAQAIRAYRDGLGDGLQWADQPKPRRRRTTDASGQLSLEGVTE